MRASLAAKSSPAITRAAVTYDNTSRLQIGHAPNLLFAPPPFGLTWPTAGKLGTLSPLGMSRWNIRKLLAWLHSQQQSEAKSGTVEGGNMLGSRLGTATAAWQRLTGPAWAFGIRDLRWWRRSVVVWAIYRPRIKLTPKCACSCTCACICAQGVFSSDETMLILKEVRTLGHCVANAAALARRATNRSIQRRCAREPLNAGDAGSMLCRLAFSPIRMRLAASRF